MQDRFIHFDPDIMASLPESLEFLDPVVDLGRDFLAGMHDLGLPWVGVLGMTCLIGRMTLMPLIYLQMQRTSKLATVIPAISQVKKLIDKTDWKRGKRIYHLVRITQ